MMSDTAATKMQHMARVFMVGRLRGRFGDILAAEIVQLLVSHCAEEQVAFAYAAHLLLREWASNPADLVNN